jgi:hypothetical protein
MLTEGARKAGAALDRADVEGKKILLPISS